MSSTANEIWDAISAHAASVAEQTGRAIVAVDAGHRVAASGIHWKPGAIVTATHLVRRAEEVTVILPDGGSTQGIVKGRDQATDIAVVKVAEDTKLATLSSTSTAKLGELVLAVARSRRGETSASAGIVARVGAAWHSWRGGQIDRLIRPDIRLYPGQSGSALVNGRGELLGVNSAVLARESVITVPVETVDRVVTELLERGHVSQPYLGIASQQVPIPPEWRAHVGEGQEYGLLVMHVVPGAPANKASINLGDVISAIDNQPVQSLRQLHGLLAGKRTGDSVQVRMLRAGAAEEVTVKLGDRPRS